MNTRICICCGEPMTRESLSRDANICASCSSLSDGMDQPEAQTQEASPAPGLVQDLREPSSKPAQLRTFSGT